MPDKLRISVDPRSDGIAVLRFTGRLDFTSAPEARDQFATASADGRHVSSPECCSPRRRWIRS